MAIITDPLTGKLKTEGGLENILNPLVLATKAPETSVSATIIDSDEADEMIEEDKKAGILPDETKVEGTVPPSTTKFEDIDVYRKDSGTGKMEAIRISTKDINKYLDEGWSTKWGEGTKPVELMTQDELDTLADEEEPKKELTPQEIETAQLTKDIAAAEVEVANAQAKINSVKSGLDDATTAQEAAAIRGIELEYQNRREKVRKLGELQKQSLNAFNIRYGTDRYAPLVAFGIIAAQERAIEEDLNDLKNEENKLIAEMRTAVRKENYTAYVDLRESLEKTRDKKQTRLSDLNKEILKKNKEMDEEIKMRKEDSSVASLWKSGTTEVSDIYDKLNREVGIDRVNEIVDALTEKKTTDDATRVEGINTLLFGKTDESGLVSASDYLEAQKQFISEGGTITDFKAAFPPETIVSAEELAKLPPSVYKPEIIGETIKSGGAVFSGVSIAAGQSALDKTRGQIDRYANTDLYLQMLEAWKADGGLEQDFFAQYPPKNYLNPNEGEGSIMPAYIKEKLKTSSSSDDNPFG